MDEITVIIVYLYKANYVTLLITLLYTRYTIAKGSV